jgi:hypothetical protein
VYLGLADLKNWRKMMQACLDERNSALIFLNCAQWFDPVRRDPFFQELVAKVGLPALA